MNPKLLEQNSTTVSKDFTSGELSERQKDLSDLFQKAPLVSETNKTVYFMDGETSSDDLARLIENSSTLKTLFNMCKGDEDKLIKIFREQQEIFLDTCGYTITELTHLPSNTDIYREKQSLTKVFESLVTAKMFEFYVHKCIGWVHEDKETSKMYAVKNFLPSNIETFISSLFVDGLLYQILPDGHDKPNLKSTQARTLRVGLLFRKTSQILNLLQNTPFVKKYLRSPIEGETSTELYKGAERYINDAGLNSPTRKLLQEKNADISKNILETEHTHPITEWFSADGNYDVNNIKYPENRDPEFINLMEFVYGKIFELSENIKSETAEEQRPAKRLRRIFKLDTVYTFNGKTKLEQMKDRKDDLVELLLKLTRSDLLDLPESGIFINRLSYDTWDNPYTKLKDTVRIYTRTLDSLGYDSTKLTQHFEEKKVERDTNKPELIPEGRYLSPLSSGGKEISQVKSS